LELEPDFHKFEHPSQFKVSAPSSSNSWVHVLFLIKCINEIVIPNKYQLFSIYKKMPFSVTRQALGQSQAPKLENVYVLPSRALAQHRMQWLWNND
jgi:hypothetical protein